MEIVKIVIFLLLLIDVVYSIVSLIDMIPVGKRWFIPRLPFLITLIVIIFQTKQRNRTFYCETCHKNLSCDDVVSRCTCGTTTKVKFVGFSGKLSYKCKNSSCRKNVVRSFDNSARTRFSRINPFGTKMQQKRQLVCNICGTKLSGEPVLNYSLYSSNMMLAKKFREDFFYHSFGPAKECKDLHITPTNAMLLKDIDRHYENGAGKLSLNSVSEEPIQLHFKTKNKNVNQTLYQFNIAVAQNNEHKLGLSEGVIVLLDGAANSIERQSVVDLFLVDIQQINTESSVWAKPVLVGVCCNGVDSLETVIDEGRIHSADVAEEICRQFLIERNNEDVINRLSNGVSNLHFFLYRTGTKAQGTQDKVYNVVNPVQALIYASQNEMKHIWPVAMNGYCPRTDDKKILF